MKAGAPSEQRQAVEAVFWIGAQVAPSELIQGEMEEVYEVVEMLMEAAESEGRKEMEAEVETVMEEEVEPVEQIEASS